MIPHASAALTMRSVALAATDLVEERRRLFKLIVHPEPGQQPAEPDYEMGFVISTFASLCVMIQPGLRTIFSPLLAGYALGKHGTVELSSWHVLCGVAGGGPVGAFTNHWLGVLCASLRK